MLLAKIRVIGHSMEPALKQNQTVVVSSIPYFFGKPRVGDIIVFNKANKSFIKRITGISGEKYFVKGDNRKDSLEVGWIDRKQILGKAIYRISNY